MESGFYEDVPMGAIRPVGHPARRGRGRPHRIVGMTKSAPPRIPVGHRVVIVLSRL
jgi:hypothetical protein